MSNPRYSLKRGGLTSLQRCSRCILPPQPTGLITIRKEKSNYEKERKKVEERKKKVSMWRKKKRRSKITLKEERKK